MGPHTQNAKTHPLQTCSPSTGAASSAPALSPSNPPLPSPSPRDGTSTMRPSCLALLLALAAGSSASPPDAGPAPRPRRLALRQLQDGSRICRVMAVSGYPHWFDVDASDNPDSRPVGRRLTAVQQLTFYCTDPSEVAPAVVLDLTPEQYEEIVNLVGDGSLTLSHDDINIGPPPDGEQVSVEGTWRVHLDGSSVHEDDVEHVDVQPGFTISVVVPQEVAVPQTPHHPGGTRPRGNGSGDKYFVAFRVTDKMGPPALSAAAISDYIFGTAGDLFHFNTPMQGCSDGQYEVKFGGRPGYDLSPLYSAPGVIELEIPTQAKQSCPIQHLAMEKIRDHFAALGLEVDPRAVIDHDMYILPCGGAASGMVNGPTTWYPGNAVKYPAVVMHEVGHNLGLGHSGSLDLKEYGDGTSTMGAPHTDEDLGLMCFSGADHWQMQFYTNPTTVIEGWYHDAAFVEHDFLTGGPQSVRLIGVGEYNLQTNPVTPIVIKLKTRKPDERLSAEMKHQEEKLYVSFNAQAGANVHTRQAQNAIVVHGKHFPKYGQTFLKSVIREGETYVYHVPWDPAPRALVTAMCINRISSPKRACVCIRFDPDELCPECHCNELVPTPKPIPGPPTNSPMPTTPPTPWFKLTGTVNFRIEIVLDEYPGETTWEVKNECTNEVVQEGGPYLAQDADRMQIEEFALDDAPARYTFTIRDAQGDGLCCQYGIGDYKVILDDSHEVAACTGHECHFGAQAVHSFGSCEGPAPPTTRRPNTPTPSEKPSELPSLSPTPLLNQPNLTEAEAVPYVKVPLNFPTPPPAPNITFGVQDLDLKARKFLPDDWGFSFSGINVCVNSSDILMVRRPSKTWVRPTGGTSTKHCAYACSLVGTCQGFLVAIFLANDPCYLVNPEVKQECNGTSPNAVWYAIDGDRPRRSSTLFSGL